eukprot:scaffold291924_cov37-Tisochrysis_lutea.AAC.1
MKAGESEVQGGICGTCIVAIVRSLGETVSSQKKTTEKRMWHCSNSKLTDFRAYMLHAEISILRSRRSGHPQGTIRASYHHPYN